MVDECFEHEPSETLDGKTRLILAGERLFAKGGIHGASMREIAAQAGQGNHAAVQYHFGSREGLVRAYSTIAWSRWKRRAVRCYAMRRWPDG